MNRKKYKGVILDIDGTLLLHNKALPGAGEAVDALRNAGYQLRFVSNTTSRSAMQLADQLTFLGIKVSETEIQTSVSACLYYLETKHKEHHGFIAVPEELKPYFSHINQTTEQPDYVVLGDLDDKFHYDILNCIFNFLRGGAKLVIFHKNPWYFRDGEAWLDSGAFTQALEFASGTQAIITGKPSPVMFLSAVCSMRLTNEQVLVVGDDVTTDIAGARNADITSLLVGSGKFKPADLIQYRISKKNFIPSIANLPAWLQSKKVPA